MANHEHAKALQDKYEIRPDVQKVTGNEDPSMNSESGVDYEPYPEKSLKISSERQKIIDSITNLYDGSSSHDDMLVYAKEAIYDDPWSYCDTRHKIAGQWYGISTAFAETKTLKTEVVQSEPDRLLFKMQHLYKPRLSPASKTVNSLVILTLDKDEKCVYHKELWNEKDYRKFPFLPFSLPCLPPSLRSKGGPGDKQKLVFPSRQCHEGLGKTMKTLQSDHLPKITRPEKDL